MSDHVLTVPEVAERLRKSHEFVRRELTRKNLVGSYYGGAWHVSEQAVQVYLSAHLNVQPVKTARRRAS